MSHAFCKVGHTDDEILFWFPPNPQLLQDFKNLVPPMMRRFCWERKVWVLPEEANRYITLLIQEHNCRVGRWETDD